MFKHMANIGAMVLRAAVVAIGVVAIKQSECVLLLAAVVLLWYVRIYDAA